MRKLVLFCISILSVSAILFPSNTAEAQSVRTVVIDPGHGGKDPGAIGSAGTQEKDVALKVAKLLGDYIEANFDDVEVIYTRSDDRFIELHERAGIANRNQADFFISIHANAAKNKAAYGTETWVLGTHRNDANLEVVKRENAVIDMEDGHTDHYIDLSTPEGQIMVELKQASNFDQSVSLARKIEDQMQFRVKRKSRGVKQAGFMVLYRSAMPSVLVELGFLSNEVEEKFLASEEGQVYLASGIYRAFKAYKLEQESGLVKEDVIKEELPGTEVVFKIQLAATKKKLKAKSGIFEDFDLISTEEEAGITRYFCGRFSDYLVANSTLDAVRTKGYVDAFIVAYKDGKKVTVQEALASVSKK